VTQWFPGKYNLTKEIISEGNFPGNKGVSNRNKGGEIRVQLEGNYDLGQTPKCPFKGDYHRIS
jgi:hypothetical protein